MECEVYQCEEGSMRGWSVRCTSEEGRVRRLSVRSNNVRRGG